jgi:hypothetical protein
MEARISGFWVLSVSLSLKDGKALAFPCWGNLMPVCLVFNNQGRTLLCYCWTEIDSILSLLLIWFSNHCFWCFSQGLTSQGLLGWVFQPLFLMLFTRVNEPRVVRLLTWVFELWSLVYLCSLKWLSRCVGVDARMCHIHLFYSSFTICLDFELTLAFQSLYAIPPESFYLQN